jgi:hypothetical protein
VLWSGSGFIEQNLAEEHGGYMAVTWRLHGYMHMHMHMHMDMDTGMDVVM